MEQHIRFCTSSDGTRIAYATTGQGPPLVRGLGWLTHLEHEWENPLWRTFIDAMSRQNLFVRYDGRGMGLSDRQVGDYSLEAQVCDLEAVVDALGLERLASYAISQGGPTAITYAARHPERVSHLILYGSFARMGWWLDTEEGRQQAEAILTLIRQGWGSDSPAFRQLSTSLFMPDADTDSIRAFNELQRISASGDNVADLLIALLNIDVRPLLPQVKVPTLVIHRRGDTIIPFEAGRELAVGIPGARILSLDGRNHWPQPSEPVAVVMAKAIYEFLGEGEESPAAWSAPSRELGGLVTILFTDVEGSTALTQRLGDAKSREVLRSHERIVREALRAHGGAEVKAMGDGFMASFTSATRALECAVAMQKAFATHSDENPEMPIKVRVGLNAGEPIAEDEDLFGTAVIVAARIAAQAKGGEILVSNVVRELAAGKEFAFSDRGEVTLKGFTDPTHLYRVQWPSG
jgi:class 3 adenylate cyclase/pimeloyl-ACP methyl ester carboxylesterase